MIHRMMTRMIEKKNAFKKQIGSQNPHHPNSQDDWQICMMNQPKIAHHPGFIDRPGLLGPVSPHLRWQDFAFSALLMNTT